MPAPDSHKFYRYRYRLRQSRFPCHQWHRQSPARSAVVPGARHKRLIYSPAGHYRIKPAWYVLLNQTQNFQKYLITRLRCNRALSYLLIGTLGAHHIIFRSASKRKCFPITATQSAQLRTFVVGKLRETFSLRPILVQ